MEAMKVLCAVALIGVLYLQVGIYMEARRTTINSRIIISQQRVILGCQDRICIQLCGIAKINPLEGVTRVTPTTHNKE